MANNGSSVDWRSAYPNINALKAQYDNEGFVIVEGILSEADIERLRRASDDVIALTRSGRWPFRRIVGKQFPPFDVECPDSWGVQHLMHPDLPHHQEFTAFYGSSPLLDIASYFLEAEEKDMQLELFNLLISPKEHFFALSWHRDDILPGVTSAEERDRLAVPTFGIQWNACLYDDDCLFVVPGTHKRIRDDAERRANQATPPSAKVFGDERQAEEADQRQFDGRWDIDPPSTVRVHLKAGQVAFYSQRILHRASYVPTRTRATLHGCYGETGKGKASLEWKENAQDVSASERARNILQHGVDWMREDSFGMALPIRLQPLWRNLLRMSEQRKAEELGFSLEG